MDQATCDVLDVCYGSLRMGVAVVPEGHPIDKRYWTTDPVTGLVHVAQSYDANAFAASIIVNCTGCNIEVNHRWPFSLEPMVVTCITCISEAS